MHLAFVQVFITDKERKEGKGKKSLSEELKERLEPVLLNSPLYQVLRWVTCTSK